MTRPCIPACTEHEAFFLTVTIVDGKVLIHTLKLNVYGVCNAADENFFVHKMICKLFKLSFFTVLQDLKLLTNLKQYNINI